MRWWRYLVGGLVEIVPMLLISSNVPRLASVQPYTPLELLGRDIYIREGCVGCQSQMVRLFRSETERYGEYSKSGEFVFDHPFLWGSKRTGPDLHRVGGKYPDAWHYNHMNDPRSTSPGSIMPRYPWLLTQKLDMSSLPARVRTLRRLGLPYPPGAEDTAIEEARTQAQQVVANLKAGMVEAEPDREILALIAYLQRLGRDIRQPSGGPVTVAHGAEFRDNLRTIYNGVPEKGMVTWKTVLKPLEIYAVGSYIYTLRGSNPPNPKPREDQAPQSTGPSIYE
nr:cytochrome-c oxidase, cbb3-type subunit II [Limisphaera ngatamarikiensis]